MTLRYSVAPVLEIKISARFTPYEPSAFGSFGFSPSQKFKKACQMTSLFEWRRERDSNPREELLPPSDLANRPLQPLGYLSLKWLPVSQCIVVLVNILRGYLKMLKGA